jgi:hypothetical protein
MSITIRIPDNATTIEEIRRLPANLERTAILRMSQIAYDQMQDGARSHSKKGDLFASIYNRAIPKGREVGHDPQRAPHALFVVFGTKPHVIRPKTKKALRWVSGNGFAFAGKVNHPGYRGDNYLQRAADEAVRQMPAIINAAIKEA